MVNMRDVDQDAAPTTPDASAGTPVSELRGSVLDVVRTLRNGNDWDAVLEIVSRLVTENADMTRRLAQVKRSFKTSEKISSAQIMLFVDALARSEGAGADGPDELDEADAKLRMSSGIDDTRGRDRETRDATASSACQPRPCSRERASRREPAARARGPAAVSSLRDRAYVHRP